MAILKPEILEAFEQQWSNEYLLLPTSSPFITKTASHIYIIKVLCF